MCISSLLTHCFTWINSSMNLYSTLYLISMDLMFAFYCCVSSAKMSPSWSPNSHCSCWLTQNGKDDCVSAGSLCWIWVWCWNQFSWFFTLLFPESPIYVDLNLLSGLSWCFSFTLCFLFLSKVPFFVVVVAVWRF